MRRGFGSKDPLLPMNAKQLRLGRKSFAKNLFRSLVVVMFLLACCVVLYNAYRAEEVTSHIDDTHAQQHPVGQAGMHHQAVENLLVHDGEVLEPELLTDDEEQELSAEQYKSWATGHAWDEDETVDQDHAQDHGHGEHPDQHLDQHPDQHLDQHPDQHVGQHPGHHADQHLDQHPDPHTDPPLTQHHYQHPDPHPDQHHDHDHTHDLGHEHVVDHAHEQYHEHATAHETGHASDDARADGKAAHDHSHDVHAQAAAGGEAQAHLQAQHETHMADHEQHDDHEHHAELDQHVQHDQHEHRDEHEQHAVAHSHAAVAAAADGTEQHVHHEAAQEHVAADGASNVHGGVQTPAPVLPAPEGLYAMAAPDIAGVSRALSEFNGKVTLVVNVASHCGYTDTNYKGLVELHHKFHSRGFDILAFPCNQFGSQEPGTHAQIKEVACSKYGAEFPLFAKVDVNGPDAAPVYRFLRQHLPAEQGGGGGTGEGAELRWNFVKFLVDQHGQPVEKYESAFDQAAIEADVEKLLSTTQPA